MLIPSHPSCPSMVPVSPSMISFIPSISQLPPAHTRHSQLLPVALHSPQYGPSGSQDFHVRGPSAAPLPVGMGMSRSLPGAGSHLSQVCRAGPCPEPKPCPPCRICFPSASSSCGPKPSSVLTEGRWAGVIPRRGLRTPSAPSPNSLRVSRGWLRSPGAPWAPCFPS